MEYGFSILFDISLLFSKVWTLHKNKKFAPSAVKMKINFKLKIPGSKASLQFACFTDSTKLICQDNGLMARRKKDCNYINKSELRSKF